MKKAKHTTKRPGEGADQFMVRMPDGMRNQLAKIAEGNGRSMNAEIVSVLSRHVLDYMVAAHTPTPEEMAENATRLNQEFKRLIKQMQEMLPAKGKNPPE